MMSIPSSLKWNLIITDTGFLIYWLVTAFGVLPPEWLFKNYANPILVAWNWSFIFIDIPASLLGLLAVLQASKSMGSWRSYALISLTLTFCAGLMAIAFWSITCDFNVWWWTPNLYLTCWPLFFIQRLASPKIS